MNTTQVVQIAVLIGFFYMMYRNQKTLESMEKTLEGFVKLINIMEKKQDTHAAKSGVEHREILDNSKNTLSIVTRLDAKK